MQSYRAKTNRHRLLMERHSLTGWNANSEHPGIKKYTIPVSIPPTFTAVSRYWRP